MKYKEALQILGFEELPTEKELKTKYRTLMMKYHPDVNESQESIDMAQKLNEANEILSKIFKNFDDLSGFKSNKTEKRNNITAHEKFWSEVINIGNIEKLAIKQTDNRLFFAVKDIIRYMEKIESSNYDVYLKEFRKVCLRLLPNSYSLYVQLFVFKKDLGYHQKHIETIIKRSNDNLEEIVKKIIREMNNISNYSKEIMNIISIDEEYPFYKNIVDSDKLRTILTNKLKENLLRILVDKYPQMQTKKQIKIANTEIKANIEQNLSVLQHFLNNIGELLDSNSIEPEERDIVYKVIGEKILEFYPNISEHLNIEEFTIKYYEKILIERGHTLSSNTPEEIIENIIKQYREECEIDFYFARGTTESLISEFKEIAKQSNNRHLYQEDAFDNLYFETFKNHLRRYIKDLYNDAYIKDHDIEFLLSKLPEIKQQRSSKDYFEQSIIYMFRLMEQKKEIIAIYLEEIYDKSVENISAKLSATLIIKICRNIQRLYYNEAEHILKKESFKIDIETIDSKKIIMECKKLVYSLIGIILNFDQNSFSEYEHLELKRLIYVYLDNHIVSLDNILDFEEYLVKKVLEIETLNGNNKSSR